MATNDELVELASQHSQEQEYNQNENHNVPSSATLYYTDLDEAQAEGVELFLNRDEATIKGEWYMKNRLPMDILELYVECYDERDLVQNLGPASSFNDQSLIYSPDNRTIEKGSDGKYYFLDDNNNFTDELVYFQDIGDTFVEYTNEAKNRKWQAFKAISPHRKLQKITFSKNPTHKQMRNFLEKVDYIRIYRPRNHLKWFTISPEEFQERIAIIQGFWGLPNLPGKEGDYKYSKRSGRWVTTNDVKRFEAWNDYLDQDHKIIEEYIIDPETWENVTSGYQPLTLLQKIARFLSHLFEKIKNGLAFTWNWLKGGAATVSTSLKITWEKTQAFFERMISWFQSSINNITNQADFSESFLREFVGDVFDHENLNVQPDQGKITVTVTEEENGQQVTKTKEVTGIPIGTILKTNTSYYRYKGIDEETGLKKIEEITDFNTVDDTSYTKWIFNGKTFAENLLEALVQDIFGIKYETGIQIDPKLDKNEDGHVSLIEWMKYRNDQARNFLTESLGLSDIDGDGDVDWQDAKLKWQVKTNDFINNKLKLGLDVDQDGDFDWDDVIAKWQAKMNQIGAMFNSDNSLNWDLNTITTNITNITNNVKTMVETFNNNTRRWINKVVSFLLGFLPGGNKLSYSSFLSSATTGTITVPDDDSTSSE